MPTAYVGKQLFLHPIVCVGLKGNKRKTISLGGSPKKDTSTSTWPTLQTKKGQRKKSGPRLNECTADCTWRTTSPACLCPGAPGQGVKSDSEVSYLAQLTPCKVRGAQEVNAPRAIFRLAQGQKVYPGSHKTARLSPDCDSQLATHPFPSLRVAPTRSRLLVVPPTSPPPKFAFDRPQKVTGRKPGPCGKQQEAIPKI